MIGCVLLPAAVVVTTLLAACGSGAGQPSGLRSTSSTVVAPPTSVPDRFVALANSGNTPAIMLYNSRTGHVVRQLLPGARDGMAVSGLSVDQSGNLWVSYSRGPKLKAPDTAGGVPESDTCANEIVVLHAGTRRVSVFLRTSDNVLISSVSISPDGQRLAYLEAGCATGYFNSYIRVVDIGSGHSWTIGQQIARCHDMTGPTWSSNSKDLVVSYGPPASAHWRGPQGVCLAALRQELVQVPATAAQPMLRGRTAQAQPGCQITSASAVAGGQMLAIEACGSQGGLDGPARLLLYDSQLRLVHERALGDCTDGNDLSSTRTGTATLVSAYLYCNPPGTKQPVTRLWSYRDGALRAIIRVPGGGSPFSLMTW